MPFGSIQLRPGVNTVATPTLNQAGISASNLIRFRDGLPEKLGGWEKLIPTAMDSITRCLHPWQDINGTGWLAAGNLLSLNVMLGGTFQDITPQTKTTNPAINVSTTAGSTTITIIDTAVSTMTQFSAVFFNTPITVGGLVLVGLFQILPTPSGSTYTIRTTTPATSTVANGGAVPSFTTVSGSPIVTVTLANHGLATGDRFTFPIATTVGGVSVTGTYSNVQVTSSSVFTIVVQTQATSNATVSMNAGLAQYKYNIAVGPPVSITDGGIGPLGQYALGQGQVVTYSVTSQTGTAITATDWTMDNWGEILLACPRGGKIWYWSPSSGFSTALPVGGGPEFNNGIFVAMPQQILVAWGSTTTLRNVSTDAEQNRLIVRWSDQLNFLNWTATSRTQAGSYTIPTGSEIMGAIQGAQQAYIFTDIDCWSMQYLGPPLVFGFNQIGTTCGLIGPHAVTNLYGRTYWMSTNTFFSTTGQGVQEIPCTVWDNVFQDLDTANASKCVAAPNGAFNEVWFFFPSLSGGTGECDKYAKVSIPRGEWDYGTLARSAWTNDTITGSPVGADPNTLLLQHHEMGYDDDGAVMNSYLETGYTAYGDGENFGVIDYFEPDMKWQTVSGSSSAQVQVTLTAAPSPNGPTMTSGPLTMTSTTEYLTPRLRGRQIKWRLETTDLGSWWRLGNTRYRYTVDGRR